MLFIRCKYIEQINMFDYLNHLLCGLLPFNPIVCGVTDSIDVALNHHFHRSGPSHHLSAKFSLAILLTITAFVNN